PMTSRFDDGALNEFLEVDGKEEAALLLLALGQPAAASTTPLPEPRFQLAGGGKIRDTAVTFLQLIHHNTTFRRTGNWTSLGIQRKPEQFPALKEGDIAMPKPLHGLELYPAIRKRRSVRRYSDAPIKIEELAALCDAAEGTAAEDSSFFSLSPGISLYAVVKDVTGVPSGVYRYNARDRSLRLLEKGDFSNRCFQASYKQDFCGTADVVFMKTLKWEQAAYPDGDRNYRYACIHAGIVGEGLYLQASALDIGVCGVGAFLDFEVAAILKILPENEVPLYLTAVGK
ncbi:MAG: SagB/ThcOx family dehydrogenase, partial [bacterium]|nr:SagB/ThcOx family dehydrogenase [bacterium]